MGLKYVLIFHGLNQSNMPLNFPTSPYINQLYTFNGKTWKWDGSGWVSYNVPIDYISQINGFTGEIHLLAGSGISINNSSGIITFSNTGVLSLGGLNGNISFSQIDIDGGTY